jgi:hypothetical protein
LEVKEKLRSSELSEVDDLDTGGVEREELPSGALAPL